MREARVLTHKFGDTSINHWWQAENIDTDPVIEEARAPEGHDPDNYMAWVCGACGHQSASWACGKPTPPQPQVTVAGDEVIDECDSCSTQEQFKVVKKPMNDGE